MGAKRVCYLQKISRHSDVLWYRGTRFNEPLYNEVLDITNHFVQPGQNYSKMYGTEP